MPAVNKAYILGGAALLALLFGSKKASAKSSTSGGSGTGGGTSDGKGDVGDPAGPQGCKDGLIVKDGKCQKKDESGSGTGGTDSGSGTGGGSGGGSLNASDLYISNKCDVFKFGDKTGDAWWKAKGKSKANSWIKSDYENLILIAYEMLRKNKEACFKDFPVQEKFKTSFELYTARLDWILKYPAMWSLLYVIRNKIDEDLLGGHSLVKLNDKTMKLEFGKSYDFEAFWQTVEPLAYVIGYVEQENPGLAIKKFGFTYLDYNKIEAYVVNTIMVLFAIIFPYIDKTKLFKDFEKRFATTEFYNSVWYKITAMEGQTLDLEFESK